jgi:hypothetical protein
MLGYDAVVQPFVQLWATIDWDDAASGDGDGLHQVSVGWGHLTNFSKGIGYTAFGEYESYVTSGVMLEGLTRIFADDTDWKRQGKNSQQPKEMRGFFASLRMTIVV